MIDIIFGGLLLLVVGLLLGAMSSGAGVGPNTARVSAAVVGESKRISRSKNGRLKILVLGGLRSSTAVLGWR